MCKPIHINNYFTRIVVLVLQWIMDSFYLSASSIKVGGRIQHPTDHPAHQVKAD